MDWVTKTLTVLILPPALLIVLMLAAMALLAVERRRGAMTLLGMTAAILYGLSTGPVSDGLTAPLERRYPVPAEESLDCDAIVVTGGGLTGRAGPKGSVPALSYASAERIGAAYRLWRRLRRPVLLSGGEAWGVQASEAAVMAEALIALGAPESDLMLEWWSRDTYENALHSKSAAAAFGWRSVCLVTSAYHLPRAVRTFRHMGLAVVPVPAGGYSTGGDYGWTSFIPVFERLQASSLALREYLALAWYRLRYGI
jgi:uncharacterized SAM-binding protein YcdF (DUF218 family)